MATTGRLGPRIAHIALILAGVWSILLVLFFVFLVAPTVPPDEHAIALMASSLIVLWVGGFGTVSFFLRHRLPRPRNWPIAFLGGAILLALVEEAIATGVSWLGPLFGAATDAARIVGSLNYFEVVTQHSVVVFIPMFAAWTWLLTRYRFTPAEVAVLFGICGLIAEIVSFGPTNLIGSGAWIAIYGLMVYLPATVVPAKRSATDPRPLHYLAAVVLPIAAAIPVALVVNLVR